MIYYLRIFAFADTSCPQSTLKLLNQIFGQTIPNSIDCLLIQVFGCLITESIFLRNCQRSSEFLVIELIFFGFVYSGYYWNLSEEFLFIISRIVYRRRKFYPNLVFSWFEFNLLPFSTHQAAKFECCSSSAFSFVSKEWLLAPSYWCQLCFISQKRCRPSISEASCACFSLSAIFFDFSFPGKAAFSCLKYH